uniref:Uncharacterized protein n=1 Tax=Termitomyces sp. TaxID=1916073 RepID=A0A386TYG8_9AGAR|nr:hypothetical protein C0988_000033 [Termitomyces sp.]
MWVKKGSIPLFGFGLNLIFSLTYKGLLRKGKRKQGKTTLLMNSWDWFFSREYTNSHFFNFLLIIRVKIMVKKMVQILEAKVKIVIQEVMEKVTNKNNNNNNKNKYSSSFGFVFILNLLDISIPDNAESIVNFSFGVLMLSLVTISCFLIYLYLWLLIRFLDKYDIENRYPRLKKIIVYFRKTSLIFILIDFILGFFCLIVIIIGCLVILGVIVFK